MNRTDRAAGNPAYSLDSVTRALTHHKSQGTIRDWVRLDNPVRFIVTVGSGQNYTFELARTHAFTVGLASAACSRARQS